MSLILNGKNPESITINGKAVESLSVNGEIIWQAAPTGPDYFYIENIFAGSNDITLTKNGSPTTGTTLEYSLDKNTWNACTYINNYRCVISLPNRGDRVYFRSTDSFSQGTSKFYSIGSTHSIKTAGDLRTLLDYTNENLNTATNYCFYRMFINNSSEMINSIDFSKITTLANHCYNGMFSGCTSLTQAPALPATTLANYCYSEMFSGCTSLTQAPALPATTLLTACYNRMFKGCTSLTTTPELPATTLVTNCYLEMFYGCSNLSRVVTYAQYINISGVNNWLGDVSATGDFYNLGIATYESGASGIPSGWTEHTSL